MTTDSLHDVASADRSIPSRTASAITCRCASRASPTLPKTRVFSLMAAVALDVLSARGIECFPKQAKLGKKGYGNLVWLPWWREAAEGANVFYSASDDGTLAAFVPAHFESAREEDVDRVLTSVIATDAASSTLDPAWAEWRKRALSALPLESIYRQWLTGSASGTGWRECRDPSSTSGDQNPSAGVADGTGEAERAAFHSFITGATVSVFDFLVARGMAPDFRAAMHLVAERSGVALPEMRTAAPAESSGPTRPRVRVNGRELRDVLTDAWKAVHATNTRPALSRAQASLCALRGAEDGPRIDTVEETAMYGHLVRIANWVRVTPDAVLDATPPKDVARDMLVNANDDLPRSTPSSRHPCSTRRGGSSRRQATTAERVCGSTGRRGSTWARCRSARPRTTSPRRAP
jgi:hypothetical protein